MEIEVLKYEATLTNQKFKKIVLPIRNQLNFHVVDNNGKSIYLETEDKNFAIIENGKLRFTKSVKIIPDGK